MSGESMICRLWGDGGHDMSCPYKIMKVFTAQQMRDFDRQAVEEYGIPSIVLMENAALRVVEFLEAKECRILRRLAGRNRAFAGR